MTSMNTATVFIIVVATGLYPLLRRFRSASSNTNVRGPNNPSFAVGEFVLSDT